MGPRTGEAGGRPRDPAGPGAGYALLASTAAAFGRLARDLHEPDQAGPVAAAEQPAALLDVVLTGLRDQIGFDLVCGALPLGEAGDGAARCLLGPALADREPEACAAAVAPLLRGLDAPLLVTAPEDDVRTEAFAADFGLRAVLAVPLEPRQAGQGAGAIVVGARDPALGTSEGLQGLGLLGGQLATALDGWLTTRRLRASEERARLLNEGASDTIYMVDAAGRFTYLNPRVERLTGYSARELLGQRFGILLAPESRAVAEELLRRSVAGEELPDRYELAIRRRDGETRTIEISATNLHEGGRFTGRFGMARDITERRRLEEELARRNRALEALNAIGALAGRAPDLPTLLGEALDRLLSAFRVDRGAIFLLDEARDELVLTAQRGYDPAPARQPSRVPAAAPAARRLLAASRPILGNGLPVGDNPRAARPDGAAGPDVATEPYVCVALRAQERALGVLCLSEPRASDGAQLLSSADSETLAIVGVQCGVLIENARLAAESAAQRASLEAKTAQLSQLLAVSAGFAANLAPDELLTTVARAIGTALNFGAVHVRMPDANGAMIGVGFYGHNEEQKAALRGPTEPEFYDRLLDERFRIGEAYYIPHAIDRLRSFGSDWTVVRRPPSADWTPGHWHPEDALVVPLRARDGALIGIIYADEPLDGRVPGRAAIDILALFARQAALAIENAGLYAQTQRDLRRQDALREVIEHISAELDFDRLLHVIIANAVELLGADAGTLALVDETEQIARVRALHNVPEGLLLPEFRPGQGLLGLVLARREPVLIDDYAALPAPLPGVPYHSCLGVPIWERDRIVGTFFVGALDPARRFGPREVETLELFAKHTALAVKNAGLYRALHEQLSQVRAISAVGTALVEERDLARVLRTVGEQVVALLDTGGCSIALLDPDEATRTPGEELTLAVVLGKGEELQGRRLPLDGSFSGAAIRTGGPVLSEDAQGDPRGFGPTLRAADVRAVLAVPLQTSERTVGALNVHDPRAGRFGPRDVEIITLFARQAAVAIENARLYEQARTLAVAEERNRLAREIHDTLAQGFTGIILQLEVAQSLLDGDPEAARERLLRSQDLARSSLQEARRSVWNLRPSPLQGRSLGEALEGFLDEWSAATGIAVDCAVKGRARPLPAEVETALLRVAQEALNNTYKHARASRITVTLNVTPAAVTLRICDDGVGFAGAAGREDGSGFGLISMRERAGRVGGTLTIASTPGQGTCVKVRVRA